MELLMCDCALIFIFFATAGLNDSIYRIWTFVEPYLWDTMAEQDRLHELTNHRASRTHLQNFSLPNSDSPQSHGNYSP